MHRAIELIAHKDIATPNYEIIVKEAKYFNTWNRVTNSDFEEESGIDPLQTVLVYKKDDSLWKRIKSKSTREVSDGYFQKNIIRWQSKFTANEEITFRLVFVRKKAPVPCLLTGTQCSKDIQISLDKVFIAYAFEPKHFRKTNFIKHIKGLLKKLDLKALIWEEKTERGHFDCKFCQDIQESVFILLEFSDSNPNVAFEFGLGVGMGKDYFILRKNESEPMPSDIRDLDRIEYRDFRVLKKELERRITDRYSAILDL